MRSERSGHSEVRDDDLGARPAGEHIDRGAAAQEVLDHLRRDDLRVGAHPFGDDAVIAGQREDHGPEQPGRAAARDLGEAPRQLLEAPETARRLGELIESVARRPARRAWAAADPLKELRENGHRARSRAARRPRP